VIRDEVEELQAEVLHLSQITENARVEGLRLSEENFALKEQLEHLREEVVSLRMVLRKARTRDED